MAGNSEKSLIIQLKSNNASEVYEALLLIRKRYTRNISKMKKFQKFSLVELILPYMEHPKCCNLAISIIADICLDLSFVEKVVKLNGPKFLMRVMKSLVNDEVRNRACRALGNIAKFQIGLNAILVLDPIPAIISLMSETNDTNCQITAVRTLTILGSSPKTKDIIVKENGVMLIAKLLGSSSIKLKTCSMKAIASLTKKCNIICARQLLDPEFLKLMVELYSQTEESIQDNVLLSLTNLSRFEEVRGELVKVGALKLFVDVLLNPEKHEKGRLAVFAICNCLDHIHMWSHNGTDQAVGLRALLTILQNKNFKDIHRHVISSLIPLSYEFKISDILLSLDLIQVLTEVLSSFIDTNKCKYLIKTSEAKVICPKSETFLQDDSVKRTSVQISESHRGGQDIYCKNFINSVCSFDLSDKNLNDTQNLSSSINIYDYATSYSPSDICSPIRKLCTSSGFSDTDQSSPVHSSSRSWSPASDTRESFCQGEICWSPVVSSGSSSPSKEDTNDYIFVYESEKTSLIENCSGATDNNGNISEVSTSTKECHNSQCSELKEDTNVDVGKKTEKPQFKGSNYFTDSNESRKRMRADNTDLSECSESLNDAYSAKCKEKKMYIPDSSVKDSDHIKFKLHMKNKRNSELSISESEKKTIDHYIMLLIFQLSFHLDKKPNSQIADKACFSVLMDYICFIHDPSPKASCILSNLIKNRYCFEKLVISGFILEIEERIESFGCSVHDLSSLKDFYCDLLTYGRQEAESDFGVGTLSHILVSTDKSKQFLVLCAISKLVTQKTALRQLLFHANGLALLFRFFVDDSVSTRKKAAICLCELYQSLIKHCQREKCCFTGTCKLKMSETCSYQKAFLNITFLVDSGEKILANREKLCENSEYFNALLKGSFLETNSDNVSMPLISASTLSTIFHFLHGCGFIQCCPYIKHLAFPILLELLSNCDRFLLLNLKTHVEDQLCHQLNPGTISKIYAKSKVHNSPELSKRALKRALSIDTLNKEVLWSCFNELIDLEGYLNIFYDIELLFKSLL